MELTKDLVLKIVDILFPEDKKEEIVEENTEVATEEVSKTENQPIEETKDEEVEEVEEIEEVEEPKGETEEKIEEVSPLSAMEKLILKLKGEDK